jgi:lipoate-protein ligase B
LLLLEHKPVYTAGRRMAESDDAIKEGERLVRETGAEWSFSKRGGEITFHGIGQMVGYCSMDLALAKVFRLFDFFVTCCSELNTQINNRSN